TSCINKKTNHFYAGSFSGTSEETGTKYFLDVVEIDKEIFDKEWPINVVQDKYYKEGKYFKINLYYYDENNQKIELLFDTLIETSYKAKSIPLSYEDKNGNRLSPLTNYEAELYGGYGVTYNHDYIYIGKFSEE
ncbi:MAG: hypothetical protein K6F59_00115, partial [Gammaproteobacteria bacterium]|nr:hypothetical protein [Gammaproteobacteria bacterium]